MTARGVMTRAEYREWCKTGALPERLREARKPAVTNLEPVRFFVAGVPIPKGSAKAFVVGSRAVVTHDNAKTKPWQRAIAAKARSEAPGLMEGAVKVELQFDLPRPKSHGKPGRKSWASEHVTRPDLDKLVRTVLDALTGIVWRDDSQVVEVVARKGYEDDSGERPAGVYIAVMRYDLGEEVA